MALPSLVTSSSSAASDIVSLEYLIPIFLAMLFAAALFSSRTRIPHIIFLIIFGIGLSLLNFIGLDTVINTNVSKLDPRLIINFLIPPLIFEAMMKVNYKEFKAIRVSAILLATIGVIIATLAAGFLLMFIAGLSMAVAFTFAALISPTDPVIVIEIFKKLRGNFIMIAQISLQVEDGYCITCNRTVFARCSYDGERYQQILNLI